MAGGNAGCSGSRGRPRAHYLIDQLLDYDGRARRSLHARHDPYVNTIPARNQPHYPGDLAVERRLGAYIRWNAMAMVLRAGRHSNVGGHIATYASAAVLYETGFNHFSAAAPNPSTATSSTSRATRRRASTAAPRRPHQRGTAGELPARGGPRRHLVLPPAADAELLAVPDRIDGSRAADRRYQARFMRYLEYRGLKQHQGRKVWAFLGDGEMDQPESLAAIALGAKASTT
nr:hypothetical protein [Burkholderia glumae]